MPCVTATYHASKTNEEKKALVDVESVDSSSSSSSSTTTANHKNDNTNKNYKNVARGFGRKRRMLGKRQMVIFCGVTTGLIHYTSLQKSLLDTTMSTFEITSQLPATALSLTKLFSVSDELKQRNNSSISPDLDTTNKTLEFVHITKTGGSAIEFAGSQVGVLWGACHYAKPKHKITKSTLCAKERNIDPLDPPMSNATGALESSSAWHIPLKHSVPYPYRTPPEQTAFFTVVRNPYDRMVSEFYCPHEGYFKWSNMSNVQPTPQILNEWVQNLISEHRYSFRRGWSRSMHYIPQHQYVFADDGRQLVQHVLRYESLEEEFSELMKMYHLEHVKLAPDAVNVSVQKKKLTSKDLQRETLKMINFCYKEDFERFGYKRIWRNKEAEEVETEDS